MSGHGSSETDPLLPTHNGTIDQYIPTKAQTFKATSIYAALKEGKLPTQKQFSRILHEIRTSDLLNTSAVGRTGRYSAEGQLVVEDVRAILDDLVKLGESKNSDDKFQRFIHHTRLSSVDVDVPSSSDLPVSRREVRKDSQKALDSIRTLGNLVLSSAEFRNILSEATFLVRDLFADAATAVADKAKDAADAARPSEEERESGIDVEETKRKAKIAKKKYQTGRYKADAHDAVASAREWVDDLTPDDPNVVKDAVIERLKKLVASVQNNSEYHDSVNTLVGLVKKYGNKGIQAAQEAKDKTDVEADDDASEALSLLREIVETVANGKSLDDVFSAFNRAVEDVKSDDRLTAYFDDLGKYIDRLLHDEGYVLTSKASRKADEFVDRAQTLIESNAAWKADSRALVDQLKDFLRAIEDDKDAKNLARHLGYLKTDLADFGLEAGSLFSVKSLQALPGIYRDFYDVVLPRVINSIKSIPLPRIEYVSADLDLAIDDFKIESVSFIPDKVELTNWNKLLLEQGYAAFATSVDSQVRLSVQGLRFSATDIAYYVNAKSGWGWQDAGLLSIDLTDNGLSFDVKLELASDDDKESFFKVKHVKVNIDTLQYSIRNSDHWFINSLLKPVARSYIHAALKKSLEHQITSYLEQADKDLFALHQRAIAASRAAPTPAAYLRALFASSGSSIFSSTSSAPTTKGVIVTGSHGEFRLHIGADEYLLPGRAGPSAEYERRKQLIEDAKNQAFGSATNAAAQVSAGLEAGIHEAGQVHADFKRQARKEALKDGWKSDAFDI